jgi:DNA polymerase kappa
MASPDGAADEDTPKGEEDLETLKYQLLGPSLTKAGQDTVDQQKASFAKTVDRACKLAKYKN